MGIGHAALLLMVHDALPAAAKHALPAAAGHASPADARDASPADAGAIFAAGNALAASGDYHGALACYTRLQVLRPTDPMVHTNIGAALARLGSLDAAEAAHRRAIALKPDLHAAINNLGNTLRDLGRLDEAHDAYRQAVRLAPQLGAYYRNLIQSKRLSADDPCLTVMERLVLADPSAEPDNQIFLRFALGQALADVGENERSFRHLLVGNALQRQRVAYDEAAALGVLDSIRSAFTADVMRRGSVGGDPSTMPVFIVGMPRSGSTLIEQILASHPDIFGGGERSDFPRALGRLVMSNPAAADFSAITSLSADHLGGLGADYLCRLGHATGGGRTYRRMTDKYLANFAYLGLIHRALPNARFIHSRREAVETCLSCFSRLFNDVPFSYDLGELGRYYRAYDALMAHWTQVLPAGVMIEVRYEDLVADVESEARRMLRHCGMEWHDACLQFHQTNRVVLTESAAQVRQPIYRTSVERWRPAAALLRPLLDGLGMDG